MSIAGKSSGAGSRTNGGASFAILGVVTVVLTLVGWSSVPLFLRHFSDSIDSWTSNGWRYGFSALVWLPVVMGALVKGGLPRGIWKAALVPAVMNTAGQVCFTQAHYLIDPALVSFGLRCQLVFVAVGAWLMFPRERLVIRTPGFLCGAALLIAGMSGVVLMGEESKTESRIVDTSSLFDSPTPSPPPSREGVEEHDSPSQSIVATPGILGAEESAEVSTPLRGTHTGHVLGVVLAVGSGLLFAGYGLGVRKYMTGMNPVLAFGAICQYTAGAMVMMMVVFGKRNGMTVLDFAGREVVLLLLSAIVGIAIGHVFYYISIARLGVAVTAGVLQLQPFLVAFVSERLFNEELTKAQWVGGVVTVTGAMLMLGVQWRMSQAKHVPSEEELAIAEGESGG